MDSQQETPASPIGSVVISVATVSVFTRHSADCSYKDNSQWRRCKCRKSLYIREGGKTTYISAKTRSWEEADRVAQAERDKRDPVKVELRRIALAEASKKAAEREAKAAKQIKVEIALDRWIASRKMTPGPTLDAYQSFKRRLIRWAESRQIQHLGDVTSNMLDEWRGLWSPEAEDENNRLAPNTQSSLLTRIKSFFKYARAIKLIDDNPAELLRPVERRQEQTMPLSSGQFERVISATYEYDTARRQSTARFGVELRAIFQLQRWAGLRITDALLLARSGLVGNRIKLFTKKTGAKIDRIIPDDVVDALRAVPRRTNIHPDQFFWSRKCDHRVLAIMWDQRIKRLNDHHLELKGEDGNLMRFHSHMLRDTFAVELLKDGMALEKVSRLLTHESIKVTERHYAPWVKDREEQLECELVAHMHRSGLKVTNAPSPGLRSDGSPVRPRV
jgi:site-specific recombinase XerD